MKGRRGLTLIELLVVMLVISILAGFAYARLQTSKDRSIIATMVSDLRAITEEQEAYYVQNRTYIANLASLNARLSAGNVVTIYEATNSGWSGGVTNARVTRQCYILVGNAAPVGSATVEGVVSCT